MPNFRTNNRVSVRCEECGQSMHRSMVEKGVETGEYRPIYVETTEFGSNMVQEVFSHWEFVPDATNIAKPDIGVKATYAQIVKRNVIEEGSNK